MLEVKTGVFSTVNLPFIADCARLSGHFLNMQYSELSTRSGKAGTKKSRVVTFGLLLPVPLPAN